MVNLLETECVYGSYELTPWLTDRQRKTHLHRNRYTNRQLL